MGENPKKRGYRGEIVLWKFRGDICDHGICIEDCDRCGRVLPFMEGEDNGEIDNEAGERIFENARREPEYD